MSDEPIVVVHAPDHRGLREVWIRGEPADKVWSARELRDLLDRSRLAHVDLDDRESVEWRDAGDDIWPDHRAKRFRDGALLAFGLLGCMVLLISIGQVDAFRSPYIVNRMSGFLLMAGGVVQGVAAIAAMDFVGKRSWPYSGALVLAGVLIALLSDGLLLALWATKQEFRTPLLPVFVAVLIWALWAAWFLARQRAWRGTPHPRSIAVGFMITSALTAANLVKTSWYEPSVAPVFVATSAKFGKATIESGHVRVPVVFKVKNTGKVPAYIPISTYWVIGRQITPTEADTAEETWKREMERGQDFDLYAEPPKGTMISAGELLRAGGYVNPGSEFEIRRIITFPSNASFTALEAGTEIRTLRKDKATLSSGLAVDGYSWSPREGAPRPCAEPPNCYGFVYYTGNIENSNNMINVTRMPRYLHARWIMHPHAQNAEIGAGVRPSHPAQVQTDDWEDEKAYGLEMIHGGGDLVTLKTLLADAVKDNE
ncbi:hypothetical protein ACFTWD_30285 [Streptomyces sp. NPDC056943]|uniref:hypothetical protein n=1 Tax=Streptomyces sp. NPDC056943 TaxID=3345971 RepID=UPI00363D69BB